MAIEGVGKTPTPLVSLYNDTFPPITGVFKALHAFLIPSQHSLNCHITSGFCGFPKFKQSVMAFGTAPVMATFRPLSITAAAAPNCGLI